MKRFASGFALLLLLNGLAWGVLGFYDVLSAAPQSGQQPFANPVDQRQQMIAELVEIKALLKEQNALLREGGK